jgi:hypothetical protein
MLTNSTVSANTAGYGGGINNGSVDANQASADQLNRGGPITLTNSTISDNTANVEGGGILANGDSQANITFCTIYGNAATGEGGGIAIVAYNPNQSSQVEMRNTLVAGNHAPTSPDIVGALTSDGYNLTQHVSGAIFIPSKQHFTDVSVDPHADLRIDPALSGKLTQIHALLSGSLAIDRIPLDACLVNSISTDQRSVKRPDGQEQSCDIGAYEYVDEPA